MPYSLVTHPLPVPFRKPGTPSSTVAVQITRVRPSSISTLPSAVEIKSGVIFNGRIWPAPRPSALTLDSRGVLTLRRYFSFHESSASVTRAVSAVNAAKSGCGLFRLCGYARIELRGCGVQCGWFEGPAKGERSWLSGFRIHHKHLSQVQMSGQRIHLL